jgi:hypothetical protein
MYVCMRVCTICILLLLNSKTSFHMDTYLHTCTCTRTHKHTYTYNTYIMHTYTYLSFCNLVVSQPHCVCELRASIQSIIHTHTHIHIYNTDIHAYTYAYIHIPQFLQSGGITAILRLLGPSIKTKTKAAAAEAIYMREFVYMHIMCMFVDTFVYVVFERA